MSSKIKLPARSGLLFFRSDRLPEFILLLCWVVMQTVLFFRYGIITQLEAHKYIDEANNILQTGKVSSPNFWLYSTQIFLIAAALKLKIGYVSVALVQLFFNAWASYALYKFCLHMSNRTVAFIVTLFFILNYPLQTFNVSLQTESIYYSLTILFSTYLLQIQRLTFKNFIWIFLFLILISFTRPSGILFIPCAFLYLFFRFFRFFSTFFKIIITVVVAVAFLYLLNIALGSGGELDFMLPFRDDRIICGVPTIPYARNIKVSDNPNSLQGLFYYITHNFDQFSRLAWLRSGAFFGLFRNYYSSGHNIYLGLYFFPFYILTIFSLKKWFQKNKYLLLYCFSLIAITWSMVMLTCDDWHNRFFLSIVPYIYILSIPAVEKITDKLKPHGDRVVQS